VIDKGQLGHAETFEALKVKDDIRGRCFAREIASSLAAGSILTLLPCSK
jgi:hypothetical protein